MIVFEIIWNILGLLYGFVGLLAFSVVVFLLMAFVAGMADKGQINSKKKGDNGKEIEK